MALHLWFHRIHLHGLNQPVDTKHARLNETLHKGKLEQQFDHLIEGERVSGGLQQQRTPIRRAVPDEVLWNVVRSEIGTQAQEFGCRWALQFELLKRERPGGGHRVRIVGGLRAPSGQQVFAMGLIELEVVNEVASCFFDIRACLVEGEWEEIQGNHKIDRLVDLFICFSREIG